MPKNIEMSVLNSEGSYDVLYPATMSEIVNISNSICDFFEVNNDSTLDDILLILGLGAGKYGYRITLLNPDDTPAVGYTINGLTDRLDRTLITDEYGQCLGVSNSTSVSVNVNSVPYVDMNTIPNTTIQSTGILTNYTLKFTLMEERELTSSLNALIYPDTKSFDVCLVGGGGGGGGEGDTPYWIAGGGGGGYVENKLNILCSEGEELKIQIGSGGSAGNRDKGGGAGGTTSLIYKGISLTANGGRPGKDPKGGSGNGKGGEGINYGTDDTSVSNATDGVGYKFNDSSLGLAGGGGGGGCNSDSTNSEYRPLGGKPYGAYGGVRHTDNPSYKNASDPTGPGGGGGGGGSSQSSMYSKSSSGYRGVAYLRFYR